MSVYGPNKKNGGSTFDNNYVEYQDPYSVNKINQNLWHKEWMNIIPNGSTSRFLYKNKTRNSSYFIPCGIGGRDPETHYIIDVERDTHPDHAARFGYARCKYGYCSGHWPGKYIESELCSAYDPQPPDTAPKRFYTPRHLSPYAVESQATVDHEAWKNGLLGY